MAKKAKSSGTGGRGRGPGPRNRRGRRGKHSKRSPFSGIERDMRARYERISQRDRKMKELEIRATGKLVTTPGSGAEGVAPVIEAVEFNAADDQNESAPTVADESEGELVEDETEPAVEATEADAEELLDDAEAASETADSDEDDEDDEEADDEEADDDK